MNEVSSKVVLGVGIAILAGMAYMTISQVSRNVNESGRGFALPELREHLNEVRGLTVTAASDTEILTLKRDSQGWSVKQKSGFAADGSAVNGLLRKLADARLLEAKTAIEQRYPDFGVEDIKAPQAKGVKITLEGLSTPVRIIIGNADDTDPERTFVRRAEDRKAWLAQGNLQVNRDPTAWLDRNVIDVAPGRIAEIAVMRPASKPLRLTRDNPDADLFRQATPGKGKKLELSASSPTASALAGLTLLDVGEAAEAPAGIPQLRYSTFDGLILEIQTWAQDGSCQARLAASFDSKVAEAHLKQLVVSSSPAPQTEAAGNDLRQRLQEIETSAKKLEQRFANVQFKLSDTSCARFEVPADLLSAPSEGAATKSAPRKRR